MPVAPSTWLAGMGSPLAYVNFPFLRCPPVTQILYFATEIGDTRTEPVARPIERVQSKRSGFGRRRHQRTPGQKTQISRFSNDSKAWMSGFDGRLRHWLSGLGESGWELSSI